MIIKKYQGSTDKEAILKAKDDLGKEAIVMNIKTIKPKGLRKIFSKTVVEVTAAIDENVPDNNSQKPYKASEDVAKTEEKIKDDAIEERLNSLAKLLEEQMNSTRDITKNINTYNETISTETGSTLQAEMGKENVEPLMSKKDKYTDLIFEQLVHNEVSMDYAKIILDQIDDRIKNGELDDLLANVYQKIILKLGEAKTIKLSKDKKPNVVCFIGPTGVGKTTTIAKIASRFKLEEKAKVAIITADTYRIAAVEQIKTYANILTIPVDVVYEPRDLNSAIEKYSNYDLILIDTAGRSHKNEEQFKDAKALLDAISTYDREVYLVVSATTKYNDLVKITSAYSDITDYSLIFTKLDETSSYGNILNIKLDTRANLAYVAWGQGVPEDFGIVNTQSIAKQLLGGDE